MNMYSKCFIIHNTTIMHLQINNLKKADIFVQCFQHLKTITDSVNIMFRQDEMYMQCMDHTSVMIFEFTLPKSWFDTYKIQKEETLGVSTHLCAKILSIHDKTQCIHLNSENREDYLSILFQSDNSKLVFDKSFEMPLLSLEYELMHIPSKEHQAEFTLPSATFASMINQLKQFGECMHIECTEEKIQLVADSQEFGKMNTHIPIEDLEEYAIEEEKTINSSFTLKNLGYICSFQKIAHSIQIGISEEFPIQLKYAMENDAKMMFCLAPRIDD